jgi:DNA-binding NarL/FixJ family response regulator
MDLYLIIAAAGSLCCLVLGIYVLLQESGKQLNRLFFLMSFSLAGFIFISNICYVADSIDGLLFRYKISSLFFGTYFALNLHFNIVFTRHRLKYWQAALLYLPAPVVIITTLTDQSLFSNFIHIGNSWEFVPAYNSFGLYFYLVYVTAYMLISIILMELYRRKTRLKKEKRQAVIINSAYFITMTFGSMCAFLFPLMGIYQLSQLGPNTYMIYYLAIFYSVFRLKFMIPTPSIMADEIIENIGEMILLLGKDFKIVMGNRRSLETLETRQEDLKKILFFDIVRNGDTARDRVDAYLKSDEESLFARISYITNAGDVLTDTYLSRIYDKFNDPSGFLVISKENKGKRQVQKAYKITDREFEVVELLLSGLPNKEIGEQLGISVRTVEAHCLHIYNKIGIKDRIELFTFAGEFNLLPSK